MNFKVGDRLLWRDNFRNTETLMGFNVNTQYIESILKTNYLTVGETHDNTEIRSKEFPQSACWLDCKWFCKKENKVPLICLL